LTAQLRSMLFKFLRPKHCSQRKRASAIGYIFQAADGAFSAESGSYDAHLHWAERNGWGDSKVEGVVSLLSGLP